MDDKSELIACIETGNFAKAARIAAGKLAKYSATEGQVSRRPHYHKYTTVQFYLFYVS